MHLTLRHKTGVYLNVVSISVIVVGMEHETVIICKDGTVNSFLSCLVAAVNKKKAGEDVCLVIDLSLIHISEPTRPY